jgi:uncharacterized protein (DUF1501 family)
MKRRNFIKRLSTTVVLPGLAGAVYAGKMSPVQMLNIIANAGNEDRVLVLIQLKGGNDGLNTLIPLDQYDLYSAARPEVVISKENVLSLNNFPASGLHPAMGKIRQLFNSNQVKIIQGVGYPNQNFSHFRSTDIWLSASDAQDFVTTGWAGRYLDMLFPGFPIGYPNANQPDPPAVEINSALSLGFNGIEMNLSMSVTDPEKFYQLLQGTETEVPDTPAGRELSYIRTTATQSNQYAQALKKAAETVGSQSPGYPAKGTNSLADQLKIVASLIAGGLKSRVYLVSLNGFDTHNAQVETDNHQLGKHADLLTKLSEGVSAFLADLEYLNIADRVLTMTFSEFGRRIKSNKSYGTDHGAASPLFIFGKNVVPGIEGVNPTIPPSPTVNSNVPMQFDFRSVYYSVLEQWFGVDKQTLQMIMLKEFPSIPIIKKSETGLQTQQGGKNPLQNYPNPFRDKTTLEFETGGDDTRIEIVDFKGALIEVLTDKTYSSGVYKIELDTMQYQQGVYYAIMYNHKQRFVRVMMKN